MRDIPDETETIGRGSATRAPRALLEGELANLRHHMPLIFATALVCVGLAVTYGKLRIPSYTSSALLVVDNRLLLIQKDAIFTTSSQTGSVIQTELEILKSPKVIRRALEIARTPAIEGMLEETSGFLADLAIPASAANVAPRAPLNEDERLKFLTARLKQRFDARRIAGTSLIEVRAMAPDPNMAAAIANAFTTAYLEDQAEANTEVARSATAWVRESVKNAGTVSRVLSNAIPPLAPDGPRPIVLLAGALAAGMLAGGAGAVIKKRLYGRVRGSADAAQLAGAECFGALPLQRKALRRTQLCDRSDPESRRLGTFGDAYAWGMTPHSIFSDTICRASVALTLEHPRIATLGVTSCFKGEGKTTVAVNLARVTAAAGYKVLLVDAASDAELTRQLTKRSGLPFDQVLDGAVALADACWTDTQTNLQFVGAEANGRWLQSKQTAQQIAQLAQHYDLVIFDLPSVAYEAHSVRAAAAALDGLLLVVEYARARPEECERCLTYAAPAAERFCGVVLSKVDRRGLKHFARRGEPHAR